MNDYIKREDALKSIDTHNESVKADIRTLTDDYSEYKDGVDYAYETIKHYVPAADVVEVVRCGECKLQEICSVPWSYDDTFFCKDGERKEVSE